MVQAPVTPLPVCHTPPTKPTSPGVSAAQGAAPGPSGSLPGVPLASTQLVLLCDWNPQVPLFTQCQTGSVAGEVPSTVAESRAVYQPPLLASKFHGIRSVPAGLASTRTWRSRTPSPTVPAVKMPRAG